LYGQDRWLVAPRLTVSAGLRVDVNRGRVAGVDDPVFRTTPWSPRLGVAWDAAGNARTIVRASYGVLADALRTSLFERAGGGRSPVFVQRFAIDGGFESPVWMADPGGQRTVDPDVRQPALQQWSAGIDHELLRGIFLTANGVWRRQTRFVEDVLQNGQGDYVPLILQDPGPDGLDGTGDETGVAVPVYQPLRGTADHQFLITNPEGAERAYKALVLAGRKRLANSWQVQGSWVMASLSGNYEPSVSGEPTSAYDSPNTDPGAVPFLDGTLAASRTHLVSVAGSYQLGSLLISAAFRHGSGAPYARTATAFLTTGPIPVLVEPRGSHRDTGWSRVDLHLERPFDLPYGATLVAVVDGLNLANSAAVLSRVVSSGPSYFEPREVAFPRRFRIGARLTF
jgi:hypothetical protein